MWLYGSGFPKSLNVSKAIEKTAPVKRDTIGTVDHKSVSTDEKLWQGWGTTLKPAWEPIIVARKPPEGTIAQNVLRYGTGALNIDGCRIGFRDHADERSSKAKNRHADFRSKARNNRIYGRDERSRDNYDELGRWPANVTLSHTEDCRQVGHSNIRSNGHYPAVRGTGGLGTSGHKGQRRLADHVSAGELVERWECSPDCAVLMLDQQSGDVSASRFYYCAKASRSERNAGLGRSDRAIKPIQQGRSLINGDPQRNLHPTVKPIALMRHLVRLVAPPGGIVLDPFMGSGSTGIATVMEGARFIGIEREAEYIAIARARIGHWGRKTSGERSRRVGQSRGCPGIARRKRAR